MAELGTLTWALNVHNVVIPGNVRGIWSCMTKDGRAVVGTFWKDQFVTVPAYGSHRFYLGEALADFGKDSRGFKRWREHLNWAWENNRRILVIEVEKGVRNKFFANPDIVMKLIALDKETGAYVAREERVVAQRPKGERRSTCHSGKLLT